MTTEELSTHRQRVGTAESIRNQIEALERIVKSEDGAFIQTANALAKDWPRATHLYSNVVLQSMLRRWLIQSAKADIEALEKAFAEL